LSRVPSGGIPALTLSGGTLRKLSDAKEFRVWVHPKSGDDFYHRFDSPTDALAFGVRAVASGKYARVELPIAVVWDSAKGDWREVVVPKSLISNLKW
jgi:hypothetical protein